MRRTLRLLFAAPHSTAALASLLVFSILVSAGASLAQAVSTPFTQNGVVLTNLATEITYTVDFSTLPLRPNLRIEAVPDASHANMQLELRVTNCNFTYPSEFFTCPATTTFPPVVGAQSVAFKPWACGAIESNSPPYVGKTCDVKVRALAFGSGGAPATFDISLRGETEVPFSTESTEITTTVQTVSIPPTKDTTIYQSNPGSSNGQGGSFWSSLGTGSNALHSLIAFNVQGNVPAGATITNARLELNVLSISGTPGLAVYAVPRNPSVAWVEGNANAAPGDGSAPPTPLGNAATWSHRQWFSSGPLGAWSTAGGDRQLPALATGSNLQTGALVLSSAALLDHVRAIHTSTTSYDGLLLVPTTGAARFASDEHLTLASRPRLVVDYFVPTSTGDGTLETGTIPYFTERQNFRWIYDLDNDNVFVTPVTGRCEYTLTGANNLGLPYTYQFQGSPSFQGLDCCTWQLGSAAGVTGTGQAIFFVNTDSSNPANQPSDLDTDGIKDLCDNCPSVPNGPLLGTCSAGPRTGSTCLSSQQCSGFACSLSQDDVDRDGDGDACVPEPGLGAMLGGGLLGLIALDRRRRAGSPQLRASC